MDTRHIHEGLRPLAVPIASLRLDERNARTHGAENLATIRRSFLDHGQVKPIAVRKSDGLVLAGNGRLIVARELGWDCLAVVMMEGSEAQLRAFALLDNRSADLAEWDDARLAETLAMLDASSVDLSTLGFSERQLSDLVASTEEPADAAKVRPTPAGSKGQAPAGRPPAAPPRRAAPAANRAPAAGHAAVELTEAQAGVLERAAEALRQEKDDEDMPIGEVVRILARRYLKGRL